jgi:hypothetical protein
MPTPSKRSKPSAPDEDGNTVAPWHKKTLPKKASPSVIADAWRGGLRAWRGTLKGPLRENRKQYRGAFVGEMRLNEEAAIKAMQEEASLRGLTFETEAARRALMRVARENYERLTSETFVAASSRHSGR